MTSYVKGTAVSGDGTTIGFRQMGSGPGVILIHGGMKSSQDFMKLALALSTAFNVYIPDRRGRGLSGPHGDRFSVQREVEDLHALVDRTQARYLFGLSSGALVALKATAAIPAIEKVALYEPPLSINGSVPTDWLPRYDRELAQGALASAVITALKGIGTEPTLSRLPRLLLVPFMALIFRFQRAQGDDVTIRALVPTQHFDMEIVAEMRDTLAEYATLQTPVLLLGGTKGPAFLRIALHRLRETLPHAQLITFPGLGHDGPEDDGQPNVIANALHRFFQGRP
jgi:pimeloyl-ACP methyl ester carboxylesterase